jgi:signal transduction histidine kinase
MQKPLWQPVDAALRKAASLLPADSITLSLEGLEGIEIYADPLLVKVFYNLIDNSLRHGRQVSRIRIFAGMQGSGLRIVYTDDGIGISDGDKEKVFVRGKGRNTGMGLFLIREILAITGITIRENGEPGRGVRFEIAVPQERFRTGR